MQYNFKEYALQDATYKGPMRRRYNNFIEKYNGYLIYSYIRGEYMRYCAQDEFDNIFVETDDVDEVREYIDNELAKMQ